MNETLPIVWIEWGRAIPKYLHNNIKLHGVMFPSYSQYLISDSRRTMTSTQAKVEYISVDQVPKSSYLNCFDKISQERVEIYSQKNFWIGTTRRFFLLHDFMEFSGLSEALHIESDNVVLDFNHLCKFYPGGNWSIAYPMQSQTLGCGSIFLVRDIGGLRKFLEFVLERWSNPAVNDMSLLGDFAEMTNLVKVLPSWPNESIAFDPGAYGKYFLGSDARNFRFPTRQRGIISTDKTSLLNSMQQVNLEVKRVATSLKVVINGNASLMNLHVHSKVIPRSPQKLEKFIRRGVSPNQGYLWRKGKLDFLVIFERFISRTTKLLGFPKDVRFR